jgi:hypothetical protein
MKHSLKGVDGQMLGNQATDKGTIAGHLRKTQGGMGLATSANRIWGVPYRWGVVSVCHRYQFGQNHQRGFGTPL